MPSTKMSSSLLHPRCVKEAVISVARPCQTWDNGWVTIALQLKYWTHARRRIDMDIQNLVKQRGWHRNYLYSVDAITSTVD